MKMIDRVETDVTGRHSSKTCHRFDPGEYRFHRQEHARHGASLPEEQDAP